MQQVHSLFGIDDALLVQYITSVTRFLCYSIRVIHYGDVIMGAMASQITGVSIVCSTVCWGADLENIKLRVTGLCDGNPPITGGFPSQRASNVENISI